MVDRPTSDAEIREACPGIRTWLYRDLAGLEATGELPRLPIAVLYETSPGFGHWVGILRTPEGIEHFDSYGLRPDSELEWVPRRFREIFRAEAPHMVRLLLRFQDAYGGGLPINFSEFRLQSRKPDVATCGRWVALRCQNSAMGAGRFAKKVRAAARAAKVPVDRLAVEMVPLPGER